MPPLPAPRRRQHLWTATGSPTYTQAPIMGSFRSPSGRVGSMTGWMRLGRFVTTSGGLRVSGVFAGELVDADGSLVGWGSRRAVAPAEVVRAEIASVGIVQSEGSEACVEVGSVDVDLLGFCVHVEPFSLGVGRPPEWMLRHDARTNHPRRERDR
jgi:hypothetical protein